MGTLSTLWQEHRTLVVFFIVLIVVIPFLIFYLSKARKEHPKGLVAAALSNMGERFGYYIMNAVLVLFICSKFGLSDGTSENHYFGYHCDGPWLWLIVHPRIQ